jgi:hypothetical protein
LREERDEKNGEKRRHRGESKLMSEKRMRGGREN